MTWTQSATPTAITSITVRAINVVDAKFNQLSPPITNNILSPIASWGSTTALAERNNVQSKRLMITTIPTNRNAA